MKANELRIGNWIYYKKKVITVDGIVEKSIYYNNGKYCDFNTLDYKPFQPIPLTEEHFKKWEFELIKFVAPNQQCGIDLFYGYDYAIKKIGNKTDLIIRYKDGKFKLDGFYSTDFKYVHTFQNFYQPLTGQEL